MGRIKNWKKGGLYGNCYYLIKKPKKPKKPKKRIHSIICYKKGASGDWGLTSEWKILGCAGTKKEIQKIAVEWLKKHPYVESKK